MIILSSHWLSEVWKPMGMSFMRPSLQPLSVAACLYVFLPFVYGSWKLRPANYLGHLRIFHFFPWVVRLVSSVCRIGFVAFSWMSRAESIALYTSDVILLLLSAVTWSKQQWSVPLAAIHASVIILSLYCISLYMYTPSLSFFRPSVPNFICVSNLYTSTSLLRWYRSLRNTSSRR